MQTTTNALALLLFISAAPLRALHADGSATSASAATVFQDANAVTTPAYPNSTCPIMGKPISTKLFVDTEKGRIWVCCKSCNKEILADVAKAHQTAYPKIEKLQNELCPVTGKKIEKDAPRVVLQGFEFSVANKEAVALAQADAQVVLARLNDPKLVDVGNTVCPITGGAVGKNAFVVIGQSIVRVSSPKVLEEVKKDPAKALETARKSKETPAPKSSGAPSPARSSATA